MPFVYVTTNGSNPTVTFNGQPTIFANNGNILGVSIAGNNYGLFGPSGSYMEWDRDDEIDLQSGGRGHLFLIGDSAKPIGAQRFCQPRLLVSCRHPCQLELRPER